MNFNRKEMDEVLKWTIKQSENRDHDSVKHVESVTSTLQDESRNNVMKHARMLIAGR